MKDLCDISFLIIALREITYTSQNLKQSQEIQQNKIDQAIRQMGLIYVYM